MSEKELEKLKEEIMNELLQKMQQPKKESVWKKVKNVHIDDFKKFDYIDHWEALNCDNQPISRDKEIRAEYPMTSAIGTLLRIVYKAENVNKVNASFEEVNNFVDKILNVCKETR